MTSKYATPVLSPLKTKYEGCLNSTGRSNNQVLEGEALTKDEFDKSIMGRKLLAGLQ